jgi:hypothetical protein
MSSIHPWVARFYLKLYLFPHKSMYSSKCFARPRPIELEGKESELSKRLWMTGIRKINAISS